MSRRQISGLAYGGRCLANKYGWGRPVPPHSSEKKQDVTITKCAEECVSEMLANVDHDHLFQDGGLLAYEPVVGDLDYLEEQLGKKPSHLEVQEFIRAYNETLRNRLGDCP